MSHRLTVINLHPQSTSSSHYSGLKEGLVL
jgi:hypothetical protein